MPTILAFGQVDLELGLYFRLMVRKEDRSPRAMLDGFIAAYEAFLLLARERSDALIVKGVNCTVIQDREFGIAYVSAKINESLEEPVPTLEQDLRAGYHGHEFRNRLAIDFNHALSALCARLSIPFFDINAAIVAPGDHGGLNPPAGVRPAFIPAQSDHHLVDSFAVRRIHYRAVLKVAGQLQGRDQARGARSGDVARVADRE